MNDVMRMTARRARMMAVAVIGTTVVGVGVAMLVLPGPGLLVIVGGLALLGTEFIWARKLMRRVKRATRSITKGRHARTGEKEALRGTEEKR